MSKKAIFLISLLSVLYAITLLALISLVVFVIWALFFPLKVNDIDRYMEEEFDQYSSVSQYVIFPSDPKGKGTVEEYHLYDYKFKGGIEVYLEMTYSPDEYTKEVERLENISYNLFYHEQDEEPHRMIKRDDGVLFNKTAYVTMYNYHGKYEYAIIDDENLRICYVCVECMTEELISFDSSLLPKMYYSGTSLTEEKTESYIFNIYNNSEINWYE